MFEFLPWQHFQSIFFFCYKIRLFLSYSSYVFQLSFIVKLTSLVFSLHQENIVIVFSKLSHLFDPFPLYFYSFQETWTEILYFGEWFQLNQEMIWNAVAQDEDPTRKKFSLRNFKLKFPKVHPVITRGLCKFHFMEMVATDVEFYAIGKQIKPTSRDILACCLWLIMRRKYICKLFCCG